MAQIIGIEEYLPQPLRGKPRLTYFASLNWLPLAAAGQSAQVLNVDADGALLIVGATRVVSDPATDLVLTTAATMTIQMTATSSGQQLSNAPTHIENVAGTAQNPCIWAFPLLLPANSSLQVTLVNADPALGRNVRLAFHGMKILL